MSETRGVPPRAAPTPTHTGAHRPTTRGTMAKASPIRWITPADRKWDANAVYKAFVELLNNADADELSSIQRIAFLAHHYDNDARSKGHARFFADRDKKTINATVRALESIGAL